mmetsp:Transcript_97712/g.276409  ORF Transcript_97712/g.276409 Transcript_97712/m.276409 type:complete len:142 (+) Transcript_97712:138-563(+)
MPEVLIPLALAKASTALSFLLTGDTLGASEPLNVSGTELQPCHHEGSPTGYNRDDLCHAPGDPNHHEVCAEITKDFWPESGQGAAGIHGHWCICVHKLGDWLRGEHSHSGIAEIDCKATSEEALRGESDAAKFIAEQCPKA